MICVHSAKGAEVAASVASEQIGAWACKSVVVVVDQDLAKNWPIFFTNMMLTF